MDTLVFILVILGAVLAIASGIWVAFALGTSIPPKRKKQEITETLEDSNKN